MRLSRELRPRVVDVDEAMAALTDGAHVLIEASGGGVLEPDALLAGLGDRFLRTGTPRGISLTFCSGVGDRKGSGADNLAHEGLIRRVVAGHWGMTPNLGAMAHNGLIEAYNLPQGVLAQLLRESAARRPGLLTSVGTGTFCDPRLGGGKLNSRTLEDLVQVVKVAGEEYLFYPSPRFDVGFIRATTADVDGNLTAEQEPGKLGLLAAATAVRNSGGLVIAQVKRLAGAKTLRARDVVVPGHLVDLIVVNAGQTQTVADAYNPAFSGELRVPLDRIEPMPLTERKVVARRALQEIPAGAIVNLGVGMADGVAAIAAEEGRLDELTLTVEQGIVGGVPARGVVFGVSWNPDAMLEHAAQFDFYDGGGLDVACLGFAEVDRYGNVNSSMVDGRVLGAGGFINISQAARTVVFCGTLTAGGLRTEITDGTIRIVEEGVHRKFVRDVRQITFSARRALDRGQRVVYITERAVFELSAEGLRLVEVAPGLDEAAVAEHMDFAPISGPATPMATDLFVND